MGTISISKPSDGQTIDAADVNTPLDTIVAVINGNLDDDNVKTGANINGSKLLDTSITNAKMSTEVKPYTLFSETTFDFVASGCVITGDSYGVNLKWSMTAGVVYISGQRVTVSALSAQDVTASKDTYIDVNSSGTVTFTGGNSVANNAASPALAASSIRLGIIQSAATITAVAAINQGQESKVVPIASSIAYTVTDSLGNLICPRDPNRKLLGYRQIVAAFNGTTNSGSGDDVTGLSVPFIADGLTKVKASVGGKAVKSTAAAGNSVITRIYDGATEIGEVVQQINTVGYNLNPNMTTHPPTPTAGLHTYKVNLIQSAAGTQTLDASTTAPAFLKVERA